MSTHSEDFEWAGALMVKFNARSVSGPTFAGDVGEISNSKVQFTAVFIGLLALMLLGLFKVLLCKLNCVMGLLSELLRFLTCQLLPWRR